MGRALDAANIPIAQRETNRRACERQQRHRHALSQIWPCARLKRVAEPHVAEHAEHVRRGSVGSNQTIGEPMFLQALYLLHSNPLDNAALV